MVETNYFKFKCYQINDYVTYCFIDNALKKKPDKIQTAPLMNNINMWGQNLESYFKDAIETKTINDWMIAVAPSVSYEYVKLQFQVVDDSNIQ